jgi:hypothetical protein
MQPLNATRKLSSKRKLTRLISYCQYARSLLIQDKGENALTTRVMGVS